MTANLPDIPRPSQLWKSLAADRKLLAAEAFWQDENARVEQAEVIATLAQRLKFRPKSVVSMPRDRKARHTVALGGVSELVAARLLVAYHLAHQRPMMGAFLDAVGIRHEEGLIADEDLQPPSREQLHAAAATLTRTHAAPDVALYLSTLIWQDPDTWGALADAPEIQVA